MGKKNERSSSSKIGSKRSARVAPIIMPLQPIKSCHRIAPKERAFLEAAERGDRPSMVRCLLQPDPVNVNCTNMLGRSAIQIAVDNENVELVELLLRQDGVKIGDALLYAIREGVFKIVEMLIDHPSITPDMLGQEWPGSKHFGEVGDSEESNDYSPDISPVILAAHCDQFEILQLLLMRGAMIDRPHQLSCSCRQCREKVHEDSLRHSLRRINAYKALASPAWISLTSTDPILTAFKLSWELEKLALRENEFKDTYVGLSDQCKRCACDLLDQCRSSEEVVAVLNKDNESDSEWDEEEEEEYDENDTEKLTLSRLKLALKYEQKQFVAHPNCQQLLTSIWYDGLPSWRKRHAVSKLVICTGLIVIIPFMAMYYWIFPHSRIGQLLRSPFMKFLYHSSSFIVFLILLTCASKEVSQIKDREKVRGPPPTEFEWLICLWVTGFIWAECKQLWEEGLKAYIRQWWNWLDFIMLSLYLTTFTLRFIAYFQIESGRYGPREMDRRHWPLLDPTMVSEGLFAVANVFSFARLIFLFQADQYLGPLQISLGCMLIDIAKFIFIFFLVISSFVCGLNQLYWYYNPNAEGNPSAFYSLESSYRTLFWSLFSLTAIKDIKVEGGQYFTETVGELLFMAYHGMAVIVLINMLIAMMSSSFQEIENHADMEWKFSRSKLWMGYFDEGSTLPPPFNIIISPKSILYFINAVKDIFCCCLQLCPSRNKPQTNKPTTGATPQTQESSSTIKHSPNISYKPTRNGDLQNFGRTQRQISGTKYRDIMRRLVSRYIHQTKKQRRQAGVNEDDLLEIKQDISSLRYEIREDRKKETSRSDYRLEVLRNELLGVLSADKNDVRKPAYSHRTHSTNGTKATRNERPPAPSSFTRYNGQHYSPAESVAVQNGRSEEVLQLSTRNTDDHTHANHANPSELDVFVNDDDDNQPRGLDYADDHLQVRPLSLSARSLNYTSAAAKVQSYISHLGDRFTSGHVKYPSDSSTKDEFTSYSSYSYHLYRDHLAESREPQNHTESQHPVRRLLSPEDVDSIKQELIGSLKTEIRDTARELATDLLTQTSSNGVLPSISSELYQTHLYTQL